MPVRQKGRFQAIGPHAEGLTLGLRGARGGLSPGLRGALWRPQATLHGADPCSFSAAGSWDFSFVP